MVHHPTAYVRITSGFPPLLTRKLAGISLRSARLFDRLCILAEASHSLWLPLPFFLSDSDGKAVLAELMQAELVSLVSPTTTLFKVDRRTISPHPQRLKRPKIASQCLVGRRMLIDNMALMVAKASESKTASLPGGVR